MEFFGDVTTACGLKTLNDYLQDRSYIRGYSPSKADADVFSSLSKEPESSFCHALRWYNHIKSLGVELKLTVGETLTTISVVKDVITGDKISQNGSELEKTDEQLSSPVENGNNDDDEFDLFGSDDEEEDQEAARIREERLKSYAEKKSQKPGPIAKSSVLLDVKPWDDETDLEEVEKLVRSVTMEGLQWGASKQVPLAFGIKKLSILSTVEDEKVSVDDLVEKICDFEEHVQSVDIAAFNKI